MVAELSLLLLKSEKTKGRNSHYKIAALVFLLGIILSSFLFKSFFTHISISSEETVAEPIDEELNVATWVYGHGNVEEMKHIPLKSPLLALSKEKGKNHLVKSGKYIEGHGYASKKGSIVDEKMHDGKWIKSTYGHTHGRGDPKGNIVTFKMDKMAPKSKYVDTHGQADPNGFVANGFKNAKAQDAVAESADEETKVGKWIYGHGDVPNFKHTPYTGNLLALDKEKGANHLVKSGEWIGGHAFASKAGNIISDKLHDGKWIKSEYAETHGPGDPTGAIVKSTVDKNGPETKYMDTHGPADPKGNIATGKLPQVRFAKEKYLDTHGPADPSGRLSQGKFYKKEGKWETGHGWVGVQGKMPPPGPALKTETKKAVFGE